MAPACNQNILFITDTCTLLVYNIARYTYTNAGFLESIDVTAEVVEDGVGNQTVFASDVLERLSVGQVKSLNDVV